MLINNANSIGAVIPFENQSTNQHIIPVLKTWKAANQGTTIVDTSLACEKWGNTKYTLAFGDDLAMRVIAHNNVLGQLAAPGAASGTKPASVAAALVNNTAIMNATEAAATSTTTVEAGAVAPAPTMAALLESLSPEFLRRLVNVAKDNLPDCTRGAGGEADPLDAGAPDTVSFQAQLDAMNENGASANLVAPFDEVEVTGVMRNPLQQSLMHTMTAACPGFDA